MNATLLDTPRSLFADACAVRTANDRPTTLAERLDKSWCALQVEGESDCPVCHGPMRPSGSAGRCQGCGSTLS